MTDQERIVALESRLAYLEGRMAVLEAQQRVTQFPVVQNPVQPHIYPWQSPVIYGSGSATTNGLIPRNQSVSSCNPTKEHAVWQFSVAEKHGQQS